MDKRLNSSVCIEIDTKDARTLKFMFPPLEKDPVGEKIYNGIMAYAFPQEIKYLFAFSHLSKSFQNDGWNIYNDLKEYDYMGIDYSEKVIFLF